MSEQEGNKVPMTLEQIKTLRDNVRPDESLRVSAYIDVITQWAQAANAELAALRAELRDTTWQDHADHWQKRAEKAEAEAARLQAAIEQAPHDKHCVYFEISPANWPACVWISPDCDCWKRAALAQEGEG